MNRNKLDVYFIMGSQNSPNPLETLEQALKAGITCFQLREKGEACLKGAAYEAFALACQQLYQRYDVPFIVNDVVALALKIEADGIHLGKDDMAITLSKVERIMLRLVRFFKRNPSQMHTDQQAFIFFKQLDMRIQTFQLSQLVESTSGLRRYLKNLIIFDSVSR